MKIIGDIGELAGLTEQNNNNFAGFYCEIFHIYHNTSRTFKADKCCRHLILEWLVDICGNPLDTLIKEYQIVLDSARYGVISK